jgi:hypothetical protein
MTSELVGGVSETSRFDRFTLEKRAPGIHWAGSWVGSRIGLDDVENRKILPLLELPTLNPRSSIPYPVHIAAMVQVPPGIFRVASTNYHSTNFAYSSNGRDRRSNPI